MSGPSRHSSANIRLGVRRVLFGVIGLVLGALFLYLALRNVNREEVKTLLQKLDRNWLAIGVSFYISSIGLRCLR